MGVISSLHSNLGRPIFFTSSLHGGIPTGGSIRCPTRSSRSCFVRSVKWKERRTAFRKSELLRCQRWSLDWPGIFSLLWPDTYFCVIPVATIYSGFHALKYSKEHYLADQVWFSPPGRNAGAFRNKTTQTVGGGVGYHLRERRHSAYRISWARIVECIGKYLS